MKKSKEISLLVLDATLLFLSSVMFFIPFLSFYAARNENFTIIECQMYGLYIPLVCFVICLLAYIYVTFYLFKNGTRKISFFITNIVFTSFIIILTGAYISIDFYHIYSFLFAGFMFVLLGSYDIYLIMKLRSLYLSDKSKTEIK
ncbi:MAG: hypothetical protein RSD40_00020 [Bacilli bacterium]